MRRAWRRLTIFQLFVITFFLCTLVYSPLSSFQAFKITTLEMNEKRDRQIALLGSLATSLFKSGEDEALTRMLRDAIAIHDIDYFVVYKNGQMIYAEPESEVLAVGNSFAERKNLIGKHIADERRSELSQVVGEDTVLTIGRAQLTNSSFFDVMFKTDAWWKVLKMELALLAITSLLVLAQTRDLAAIKSQLLKSGRIS